MARPVATGKLVTGIECRRQRVRRASCSRACLAIARWRLSTGRSPPVDRRQCSPAGGFPPVTFRWPLQMATAHWAAAARPADSAGSRCPESAPGASSRRRRCRDRPARCARRRRNTGPAPIRLGDRCDRLRLALAAQLVGGGARVGQQHGAVALGIGADLRATPRRPRHGPARRRAAARTACAAGSPGCSPAAGRRGGCAHPRSTTPKPFISAFTWSRIAAMIRSRSADSTSSSWLLPSTRRRLDDTIEFSRPRMPSSAGPTAW